MLKKNYITPEMIIRRVVLEGFMQLSVPKENEPGDDVPDDGWGPGNAESKSDNNKSFDIWED